MEQAVLAGHELYEAAIRHDAAHGALVHFAHFGNSHDGLDLCHGSIDGLLIGTAHLYLAYAILLVDGDGGTGLLLHTLDNLSARANHCTDELLGDGHLLDAWYVGLQFGAGLVDGLHHLAQDVLSAGLGLHERLLQNLVRESVALDIHLCGSQSVYGTCSLEVHVAQVVLIAQDVAQHGVLVLSGVLDKAHGDAAHSVLDGHTSVHQSQTACAGRCH